jgi:hypothetical protein
MDASLKAPLEGRDENSLEIDGIHMLLHGLRLK